jgi:hypothetical protein
MMIPLMKVSATYLMLPPRCFCLLRSFRIFWLAAQPVNVGSAATATGTVGSLTAAPLVAVVPVLAGAVGVGAGVVVVAAGVRHAAT